MIPRTTVAAALGLPAQTDALPPGDLPLDRFVTRLIAYLSTGALDAGTVDAWTGAVMDWLIAEDPERALAVIRSGASLPGADALADPLAELAGMPGMRSRIEDAASGEPALAALVARANGE